MLEFMRTFAERYPFPLDPFQQKAMRALAEGQSVLAVAPTGTGKTVLAEFAIARAREQGRRAFYTSPIKALSGQKYRDWQVVFGAEQVGLLTGDISRHPEAPILVMTTEVLRNMLLQDSARLDDAGCIIFDEIHFLADPERGTSWEEAILHAPAHVPLVCLSATIANAREIADWITRVHGPTTLVTHAARPVPLRHLYWLDGDFHLLVDSDGAAVRAIPSVGGEARRPRPAGVPMGARPRAVPNADVVVGALAREAMLPAIYFLFSRRACEQRAAECRPPPVDRAPGLRRARRARIAAYLAALPPDDRELSQVVRLRGLLEHGIAFHHAGLLPVLKQLVEELFAAGMLGVVFATETLSLGINVPARTVVVGEPTKFDGAVRRRLSPNEYAQLTGRAGRRGLDEVAYAVNLYSPWASATEVQAMAVGQLEPIQSAFLPRYHSVATIYGANGTGYDRLRRLFSASLRRYQLDHQLQQATAAAEALRRDVAQLTFDCPVPGLDETALADYRSLRRRAARLRKAADQAAYQLLDARRAAIGAPAVGWGEQPATMLATTEREALDSEAVARTAAVEAQAFPCHTCPVRRDHERVWRRRAAVERELAAATARVQDLERESAAQAASQLDGVLASLRRYDFLTGPAVPVGTPTIKAAALTRLYDPNGLLLIEALWRGAFDDLTPVEIMEVLSWFCNDRDTPRYNRYFLSNRLWTVRNQLGDLAAHIRRTEEQAGLSLTTGPNFMFYGPVQDWCRGTPFAGILEKMDLGEGDLLLTLNKTLDLASQLRQAAEVAVNSPHAASDAEAVGEFVTRARALMDTLDQADPLVRRGIVVQSLELMVAAPAANGSSASRSVSVGASG